MSPFYFIFFKGPSFPADLALGAVSILRLILRLPWRTASELLYIQGRHVSEKVYFQRDDSELKECGRGCKQHDPSGSVPPHVIALFRELWYPSVALL